MTQEARLSGLALKALDVIEEQYGDADLGDALLIFEVLARDEHGDGETGCYTHRVSTTDRVAVIQGLVTTADKSLVVDA